MNSPPIVIIIIKDEQDQILYRAFSSTNPQRDIIQLLYDVTIRHGIQDRGGHRWIHGGWIHEFHSRICPLPYADRANRVHFAIKGDGGIDRDIPIGTAAPEIQQQIVNLYNHQVVDAMHTYVEPF